MLGSGMMIRLEGAVVAQHGEDDVDPSAGQAQYRLNMTLTFPTFALVVGGGLWADAGSCLR